MGWLRFFSCSSSSSAQARTDGPLVFHLERRNLSWGYSLTISSVTWAPGSSSPVGVGDLLYHSPAGQGQLGPCGGQVQVVPWKQGRLQLQLPACVVEHIHLTWLIRSPGSESTCS